MIFDILETKKSFQNFKAQHVPRSYNVSAHSLAKLALRKLDSFVWLDKFPIEVLQLFSLSNEMCTFFKKKTNRSHYQQI